MHKQSKRPLLYENVVEEQVNQRQVIIDTIIEWSSSSLTTNDFLQKVVDILKDEYLFNFVGLFLLNSETQFLDIRAGTGRAGQLMLQHQYRWHLSKNKSLVSECFIRNAVCIDMLFSKPFEGFFYGPLSSDVNDKNIQPFTFVETFFSPAPDIGETEERMIIPLRTHQGVLGTIEFHSLAVDMGRNTAHFILPVVDCIAEVCLKKMKQEYGKYYE